MNQPDLERELRQKYRYQTAEEAVADFNRVYRRRQIRKAALIVGAVAAFVAAGTAGVLLLGYLLT